MEIQGVRRYPSKVTRTVFVNGLTVITIASKSRFARVELCFDVGALDDGDHFGLGHLQEHCRLGGRTPNGRHLARATLAKVGAKGNGATDYGETWYHIQGLAEHLSQMVQALFSIGFDAETTEDVFESSRRTVMREIDKYAVPRGQKSWVRELQYPEFPNLLYPVFGNRESISGVSIDDLRRHHEKYYRLDNVVLIVEGGIRDDEVQRLVERSLSCRSWPLPRPRSVRQEIRPELVSAKGSSPFVSDTVAMLFHNAESFHGRQLLKMAISLLCHNDFGSLMAVLRKRLSLAYSIDCTVAGFPLPLVTISVSTAREGFDDVVTAFWEEADKISSGQIDETAFRTLLAQERMSQLERYESIVPPQFSAIFRNRWLRGDFEDHAPATSVQDITMGDIVKAARYSFDRAHFAVYSINGCS